MPNYVTNKIIFASEHAARIFAEVMDGVHFDFNRLIPQPPGMYHGDLAWFATEKPPTPNWYTWNTENWGTQDNAYECSIGDDGDTAWIKFDTSWSCPHPVISAFASRTHVSFEYRYFDEGHNFWGIQKWDNSPIQLVSSSFMKDEDKKNLCLELKGYDPDELKDD